MRAIEVVIYLCLLVCSIAANVVQVPSDAKPLIIRPQTASGTVETMFDLRACDGCKMILSCAFQAYSCNVAKIFVHDGQEVSQHCPEVFGYVFKNSWKSRMSVTFLNTGSKIGAFCQVKATRSYLDLPEEKIDSSEHGLIQLVKGKSTCKCGWANRSPRRIVGGEETDPNEYPFTALLVKAATLFPFCGGSVITEYHALTAAHCTEGLTAAQLAVILGEHDIRTTKETPATHLRYVSKIYEHAEYNPKSTVHDISILEFNKPIVFSDKVGPVCLPNPELTYPFETGYVKVMGWGLTADKSKGGRASPILRKVNLKMISHAVCEVIYSQMNKQTGQYPTQFCSYNNRKDSCQGDSGGPLVLHDTRFGRYTQLGVVSFGRLCGSTDPAVNTYVPAYMPWIKSVIKSSKHNVDVCIPY